MRRAISLLPLLALVGCNPVEPAPEDVDGLARWFFTNHLAADDGQIEDAVASSDAALGALADPRSGVLEALTDEEVTVERDTTQDLADAQGFFIATQLACDMAAVEEIVTAPNQDEQYDGYDEYERRYTSDESAYLAGDEPTLTWDVDVKITPITSQYSAQFKGGVRRVPDEASGSFSLLQFTWMPAPATFDDPNNRFEQDFQIEAYFPRDGEVVHFYGMWREMQLGAFSIQDDTVLSTLVDGLIDWDRRTEELCAGR